MSAAAGSTGRRFSIVEHPALPAELQAIRRAAALSVVPAMLMAMAPPPADNEVYLARHELRVQVVGNVCITIGTPLRATWRSLPSRRWQAW